MNRLEYDEVLNAFKIFLSRLDNFKISFICPFEGSCYAEVKVNIPLEVKKVINAKYRREPNSIMTYGICRGEKGVYQIISKKGLVLFLNEIKDYYDRKDGLVETDGQNIDEIKASIDLEIIKKVNPSITAYEWLQADEDSRKIFSQIELSKEKTPFWEKFRKAIDNFDKAVNPFINQDIELDEDDIKNFLKNVDISTEIHVPFDDKKRAKECRMSIMDLNNINYVDYNRYWGCLYRGLQYELHYTLENEKYLDFIHYYCTGSDHEEENGEFIIINYWGDKIRKKVEIKYNITKNVVEIPFPFQNDLITLEQEKFIYKELLKAIRLASTITLDNMKKKNTSKSKQLLPNKLS